MGRMSHIREHYGVPAKRGRRMRYLGDGTAGAYEDRITSAMGSKINILWSNSKYAIPCLPTDAWLQYLSDDGEVLWSGRCTLH